MKTPHKLSNLILLLIALIGNTAFSQSGSNLWEFPRSGGETVTEPSPAAEAMRRYNDIPVSYSTGATNISIPLFELPGGLIDVNLGLSYHTGGIKCGDFSSGIGLGWSLTGLGSISRQINGFPDEWKGATGSQNVDFNISENSSSIDYYISILEGRTDCEYDLYSYYFPGYAGYFILKGSSIVQLPRTELDITRVANASNTDATEAFVITTPDGIEYRFDVKENIEYRHDTNRLALNKINRGYDAVTTWNLSKIVDAERVDSIIISYETLTSWQRDHDTSLANVNMKFYTGQTNPDPALRNDVGGSHYTKFLDPKAPKSITSRSGKIVFDIDRNVYKSPYSPRDIINGLKLYNNEGKLIKTVKLNNKNTFSDSRQRLDNVSIFSDDVLIDMYEFRYRRSYSSGVGDVFGYPSYSYPSSNNRSILNSDLKLSTSRKPCANYNALLDTVIDIKGLMTTLDYEPSVIEIPDSLNSIFTGKIIVGSRIKTIKIGDGIKTRRFIYGDSMCNIDLSRLTYDMFLSQSGLVTVNTQFGITSYSDYELNTTFTSSSKTRGFPVEYARVYYGQVTELVTGTGIEKPIKTVYKYDLSNCINDFINKGGIPGYGKKALGMPSNTFGPPMDETSMKIVGPHPTRGYFRRIFGGGPLLKTVTNYEYTAGKYEKRLEKSIYYSGADSTTITDGIFCESSVYRARELNPYYPSGSSRLNIDSKNDINFFSTEIKARRIICDSILLTTHFPDGNSRTVVTRYNYMGEPKVSKFKSRLFEITDTINKGDIIQLFDWYFPGFDNDSIITGMSKSFYPLSTTISCNGDSETFYDVRSEYTGSIFRDSKSKVRQKRLPVIEKWILRSNGQSDSLFRQYEYGNFSSSGKTVIRPTRIYQYTHHDITGNNKAIITSENYSRYDRLGRVTEMTDLQGRTMKSTWLDRYDLLAELSHEGCNLTMSFTHDPLTGCKSITMPNGRTRYFSYRAGRLVQENNTQNDPLVSYEYHLLMDGSAPQRNTIARTIYDTDDEATETVGYDPRGLPNEIIKAVAGGGHTRSYVHYDALDRPIRQWLPIPSIYGGTVAVKYYYNDSVPAERIQYTISRDDRPVEITTAGSIMSTHPTKCEYLCNSADIAMLKCKKYILQGDGSSEVITLAGDWSAGSLDVTKLTDPDGCITLVFSDWRGLKMLERHVIDASTYIDTYYIYDVRGNVRVIIQPQGTAMIKTTGDLSKNISGVLSQYAFIYRYDRRGNCIYYKQPGAGATETRYDILCRPAFRSTAVMKQQGEAEFILYDAAGRVAVTGISYDGLPDENKLHTMTTSLGNIDSGIDGTGYTVPSGVDLANANVTLVNYYDNYNFTSGRGFVDLPLDNMILDSSITKGMLTGTRMAVFGETINNCRYIYSIDSFDKEGQRISRVESTLLDSTYMHTALKYSRLGYVTQTNINLHTPDSIYSVDKYDNYDIFGNPVNLFTQAHSYKKTDSSISTRSIETISYGEDYFYDTLGRLEKTRREMFWDNVTQYTYNMRGQVTSITNPSFTQTLKYEDGDTPCYNGNISQMTLTYTGLQPVTRKFTYDKVDRLASMTSTDGFSTTYTYNLNSSPLEITRHGHLSDGTVGLIDDLSLTYTGNHLTTATDAADPVLLENSLDFYSDARYSYDLNGRLTSDTGRDMDIEYNVIDRISSITTTNSKLAYNYSATGKKLAEHYTHWSHPAAESRYYIGPFELIKHGAAGKSGIARINTNFGYFDSQGAANKQFADYQGNIRATITANSNTHIQTTDYYPYGLPMATSTGANTNRYKYSANELETRDGINLYLYPFRQLLADVALWSTLDPLAILTPSASPYSAIGSNPIKYIDPLGLYKNKQDADAARWLFGGASVHYATDKKEFYLALNETGTWRYTSGGTLTRYFGEPFLSFFEMQSMTFDSYGGGGGSGIGGGYTVSQLPTWVSVVNTTAASLGIANSVKGELIDYALPLNKQNGTLARYMKITKNIGRFCSYANAMYSLLKMDYYYRNGGENELVYLKYSYDTVNSLAPNWFVGTPAYIWVSLGSLTYTIADGLTDGFWINYSIPTN